MKVLSFHAFLLSLAKMYWKILRPKTFGVKGVIPNPDDDRQVLLIRNSYGNRQLWNLPGGGYNPTRELADDAIGRELREELSITPLGMEKLGEYLTDAEGKRDRVTLFLCRVASDPFEVNREIAEFRWVSINHLDRLRNIARVALYAVGLYRQRSEFRFDNKQGHLHAGFHR